MFIFKAYFESVPDAFLVPTYQIDLVWHSHMLSSHEAYSKDCTMIAGCVPDHDDSVSAQVV
jgi:hypothetical protein